MFFELLVPSWERSHIPSRWWVSLGPAWWDMWSSPGGYSNLVVYCREWAGKTAILLWRLNLNRLKPPTSTTHWREWFVQLLLANLVRMGKRMQQKMTQKKTKKQVNSACNSIPRHSMHGLFTYILVVYVVNRPHMTTHYLEQSHEKFTTDWKKILKMLDFPATGMSCWHLVKGL